MPSCVTRKRAWPVMTSRLLPSSPIVKFWIACGGPHWDDPESRTICVQLDASTIPGVLVGQRLFFIYNAHFLPQKVNLPALDPGDPPPCERAAPMAEAA